jgi:UDP-glucose 4-epimerase
MRILATGGAGYVGSAALRYMLERGHEVWAYDNLSKGHRGAVPSERLIEGDLADREWLVGVLREREIEAVMHFAAFIEVGESVERPTEYYRNNLVNSLGLLEAMLEAEVGKIIFSSTAAVYGPSDEPLDEDAAKAQSSPYGFSKFAIERLIEDFSSAYGLGYVILRYFNACGASGDGEFGEDHSPESHLIPLVLQVPLGKREKIFVFGEDYDTPDGTCVRDYVHVDDLADAHMRAVEAVAEGCGRVYNIGTGRGNSVREVIEATEAVVGHAIAKEVAGRRAGDTARLVASSEKLQRELGWEPRYTELKDIIGTAWKWHQGRPRGYGDR